MGLEIKKGDKVVVIAGKNKGKIGKVLRVSNNPKRIIVEGVNLVKKHVRRRSESETGGIKEVSSTINASNVALFCGSCNKGVRFGVKISDDKSKVRICRKCQRPI